jgi:hypothetical protein
MLNTLSSSTKNNRLLLSFIFAWIVLNILQACFTGLDGDETYYWTYAQHLQWGYFDHPPMVALSIKLGELFGHGWLYTRAGAILLSAATIYFGFKALPERLQDAKWYALVFASVLIFHIYGFITTPDAPLLFFTPLFFYAYKLYVEKDSFSRTLFLAFSIIGLMYSKYHGVLPVFFTFLSNPKLVLKRSAWMIVLLTVLAFLPHLWWQYQHDWPTFRYHLFERNRGNYQLEKTTNYILGQLLIFGPFTTLVALIVLLKRKFSNDPYFRSHVFTFFGVLIFFLFSSFKKNVEPHWTLVVGVSFLVLVLDLLDRSSEKFKKAFFGLAAANIVLILLARILLAVPTSPANKIDRFQVQIYSKSWADSLYKHIAGMPVVFIDNYTYPSIYKYYHPDQLVTCYSSVFYRKNNYTLHTHQAFNNKTVYTVRQGKIAEDDIEVKSNYVPTFLHKLDSFKAITGLKILWKNEASAAKPGQTSNAVLELSNPLDYTVNGNHLFVNYTFFKTKNEHTTSENFPVNEQQLPPGFQKQKSVDLVFPKEAGKYRLIFSFDQPFVGPSFASSFYDVEIKP